MNPELSTSGRETEGKRDMGKKSEHEGDNPDHRGHEQKFRNICISDCWGKGALILKECGYFPKILKDT